MWEFLPFLISQKEVFVPTTDELQTQLTLLEQQFQAFAATTGTDIGTLQQQIAAIRQEVAQGNTNVQTSLDALRHEVTALRTHNRGNGNHNNDQEGGQGGSIDQRISHTLEADVRRFEAEFGIGGHAPGGAHH